MLRVNRTILTSLVFAVCAFMGQTASAELYEIPVNVVGYGGSPNEAKANANEELETEIGQIVQNLGANETIHHIEYVYEGWVASDEYAIDVIVVIEVTNPPSGGGGGGPGGGGPGGGGPGGGPGGGN